MLQGQEILVILLVALVVLGPKRLPELAQKLGSWTAELRKAAREIRDGLEAEVGDVRRVADEFGGPFKEVNQQVTDAKKMMDDVAKPSRWIGPEPAKGPTSADAMADLAEIEEKGEAITDTAEAEEAGE